MLWVLTTFNILELVELLDVLWCILNGIVLTHAVFAMFTLPAEGALESESLLFLCTDYSDIYFLVCLLLYNSSSLIYFAKN